MGVVTVAPEPGAELPHDPPPTRHAWIRVLVVLVVVVAVVCGSAFAADGWWRGGTRLEAAGAGIGTAPEPLAVSTNIGVQLDTRGGPSVFLESVRSDHSPNISVTYAIVHTAPGELGIGTSLGSITAFSPIAVRGARVAQPGYDLNQTCTTAGVSTPPVCTPPASAFPDLGTTSLIVTVRALRPGRWSVTNIRITYKSWRRTRHVTAGYEIHGTALAH